MFVLITHHSLTHTKLPTTLASIFSGFLDHFDNLFTDDELPDYVMVMVANKRTRAQMEDDLQLFLGDNTELFVNWLHQVLKKLQEVTVAAPAASM